MRTEAPYSYIEWYYNNDWRLREDFPDQTAFVDRFLSKVDGETVLNAGCGPQFFDLLPRFRHPPKEYVGIDIGRETYRFLTQSKNSRFLACREAAIAIGTKIEPVCADIFTWPGLRPCRFDCIVATGFIGTFHNNRLSHLLQRLHTSLKSGGRLVKLTWHGPHRTPEQTARKIDFGYDSIEEHDPQKFLETIAAVGFEIVEHELNYCDPETYRWDIIQGALFEKR